MLTTVYIVTSGCYSDKRIEGVFSTKSLANEALAFLREDDRKVEEWVLDDFAAGMKDPHPIFSLTMHRDGTTSPIRQEGFSRWAMEKLQEGMRICPVRPSVPKSFRILSGWVRATDEQHAVKIANEYRTRLIAEGKWQEDER